MFNPKKTHWKFIQENFVKDNFSHISRKTFTSLRYIEKTVYLYRKISVVYKKVHPDETLGMTKGGFGF